MLWRRRLGASRLAQVSGEGGDRHGGSIPGHRWPRGGPEVDSVKGVCAHGHGKIGVIGRRKKEEEGARGDGWRRL